MLRLCRKKDADGAFILYFCDDEKKSDFFVAVCCFLVDNDVVPEQRQEVMPYSRCDGVVKMEWKADFPCSDVWSARFRACRLGCDKRRQF